MSNDNPARLNRWNWIALILPLIALSPLLYMQCRILMQKPHLQFFPLAVAACVYFLGQSDPSKRYFRPGELVIGAWLLSMLSAMLALYLGSPWLSHFVAIMLVGTWALLARPGLSVLRVVGICGLLVVTLPAPLGWDKRLISGLQSFSSIACSRLMDLTNIVHVRRGNIIEVPSKPLFVEEACSGVDSQYALMAVAGVLLLLGRAHWWVSLVTILTVPIWAILGNLLRIYLIVIGLEWFGIDLSHGTTHTFLGLGVFVFTAWVHWSSVQFLNYLHLRWSASQLDLKTASKSKGAAEGELHSIGRLGLGWAFFPLCLFVFFPESVRAVMEFHASPDLPSITQEESGAFPGASDLVAPSGSEVVGFHTAYRDRNDMLGQHSRIWELSSDLGRLTLSLDFPFRGWHPLWECYINSGWHRERSELIETEGASFFETVLRNDLGDLAILHFSLFDQQANPYKYEGSVDFRTQSGRWANTILNRERPGDRAHEPMTFQFQQIAYTSALPSEEQLGFLRKIFLESRVQVVSQSANALAMVRSQRADGSR
ncbi:MAG: exosortase U [Pirellula sp.]|nr:exosortase U [Pirellula sp.]